MKRKTTRAHRNFKLPEDIDRLLRAESKKTLRTQTAILEIALRQFFALKPSERNAA